MTNEARNLLDTKTVLLALFFVLILIISSQFSFLLFHTLAEFFAIVVAILTTVVAWQMYAFTRNHFLMYLGCGYFWIAALDMVHTLTYKGMTVFPGTGSNLSIQLWIGTRYLEALLLLTSPLFLSRSLRRELIISIYGVIAVVLFTLVMSGHFPIVFIDNQGLTAFKIYSEYIIIAIISGAIFYLVKKRKLMDQRVFVLMIASMVLTMVAELAFTFYVSVYGLSNLVGHIFKLLSFWLIFIAVVRTTLREPFSALSKSETYYDAVPDATIIVDKNGIIQHVNKPACQLAGQSSVELIGQRNHSIFHDIDTRQKECEICQLIAHGTELPTYELQNSEQSWFDISISLIPGENSFIEVIRDISNRKKTLIALEKSEANLSITLKSIGDAVITTDTQCKVTSMNPAAEQLTGWLFEEAEGALLPTIFPILDASSRKPIDNPVDIVLATGKTVYLSNHTTLMAKDGSEYQIADSAAPIRNENNEILGMVLVFNDVTEEYLLREAAAKSRRVLQAMMDHSPAVIYVKDIDCRFIFVNQRCEQLLNNKLDNIIGKSLDDIFPDEIAGQMQRNDKMVLETGQVLEYEEDMPGDDGLHTYASVKFPLFDDKDEIYAVCSISSDITVRKDQEAQLRRTQKMDALGKLTGGIAHDFNNMLGVVTGYASLLQEQLGKEHGKLAKYALQIQHAGERGARLTKKLLAFSREKSSEAQEVKLNVLLHEQQHMLEKTLTVRIKLVFDLIDDLWPIWLDASDMEDAILNLGINAMHAIEGSGQLTFWTRNESLDALKAQQLNLEPGDYVILNVTDTGCGMDEVTKERIFEPFYSTKGDKGTGLGLSQVYGFVKRSNGAIKVFSEPGRGSQFVLYFPRYLASGHTGKVLDNNKTTDFRGNESILIVDDEAALLSLSREILTQQGYKVYCAERAKVAMKILETEAIDLLLSDVIMPDMDGFQLASSVQKKYPEIKIQLISGFSDSHNFNMIDESLRQNLLQKPINSKVLLQKIRALLDNEKT